MDYIKVSNNSIQVALSVVDFTLEGLHYVSAPSLDLMGYGNNFNEAVRSFEVMLDEYFRHAYENGTLIEDLTKNGWRSNTKTEFKPLSSFASSNIRDRYGVDDFNFTSKSQNIRIPVA